MKKLTSHQTNVSKGCFTHTRNKIHKIRRITKYSKHVYALIYDVLFVVKKTYQFLDGNGDNIVKKTFV